MTKTTKPKTIVANCETGEVETRDMTDAEFARYQADMKIASDMESARNQADANKAAILNRIGLTEDELKTILN